MLSEMARAESRAATELEARLTAIDRVHNGYAVEIVKEGALLVDGHFATATFDGSGSCLLPVWPWSWKVQTLKVVCTTLKKML